MPSRRFPSRAAILLTAAAGFLLLPSPLPAQPSSGGPPKEAAPPNTVPAHLPTKAEEERALGFQASAFAALEKGDLPGAEEFLRKAIAADASNFVLYYNLACVLSLQGHTAAGADSLVDAIEHGFVDLVQLKRDPQLSAVRRDPRIARLIESWPTVLQRQLEANLKSAASLLADKSATYDTTRDERLRIAVISAMDPKSTEQARADISRLYDWGLANVLTDLADPDKSKNDAWCVVILPTPKDFLRWLVATYGRDAINSFSGIGGSYINDQKRLVAQDLGATLRHEFFHVLHWRSMIRLAQDHPIWIQEGLCSLVEDYESGDGKPESLKPVPSWRSNMARKILTGGHLLTIKQLAAMPRERFTGSSPLANYAQARTLFLYIWTRGKLKDWYTIYTTDREQGYHTDRSGVKALEAAFGKPVAELDKDYRIWLRAVPMVAEQNKPGEATLSVDVEQGDGDGPVIANIPRDERGHPNPARRAGLRIGDVITAIDGKPTRDLNELVRLLGEHQAGDQVEVSYRRGKVHATVTIPLVPR